MIQKKKLVIAGGGTGGHIHAGIAISEEWKKVMGEDAEILFIGSKGRLEEKIVPRYHYPLRLLSIGPLNRVSLVARLRTLFLIPFSLLSSFWILLRFRPDVVMGVGGYSSGPVLLAAKFLSFFSKIRIGVLEQNAVLGMTNRILAKVSHLVFSSFPLKSVPEEQSRLVGNPVRMEMKPLPPAETEPFTVFIFGGSQGSMGLNTMILEALPLLAEKVEIIHQTGEIDFERVKSAYEKEGVSARVEKFIFNMMETYEKASLVIGRAGASTLSELAVVQRASILVPLPTAADDHQTANAKYFEEKGATRCFPQGDGEALGRLILDLKNRPEEIRKMEETVSLFHRTDAAKRVVQEIV